jgi:methanogenic corrinoid protein MtbC1
MDDTTPIYNLKAVMREVGLSAATLRAWELRYGLPKPQRTAGGHRLYSKLDIELIKWLIEQQKAGLSISRAVELWKTMQVRSKAPGLQLEPAISEKLPEEGVLDDLRGNWIRACCAYDDHTANQILDQAFAIAPPETICLEVLQKGMAEIGQRWYAAAVSVQQEHFASAVALRRINNLLAAVSLPTRTGRILAACPPGEQHDFILMLIAYLLRREGWEVVYLGANVPLKDLDRTIKSTQPKLIVSSAQTINSAATLRKLSESVLLQGVPLAYGGGIFCALPDLTRYIKGFYLGSSILKVSQEVEQLVKATPEVSLAPPVPPDYLRALELFRQSEPNIASDVETDLKGGELAANLVQVANANLGQMISSALIIGDINLLDQSVEWLNGLLRNYGFSTAILLVYYSAYSRAVFKHLGSEGKAIWEWLGKKIAST